MVRPCSDDEAEYRWPLLWFVLRCVGAQTRSHCDPSRPLNRRHVATELLADVDHIPMPGQPARRGSRPKRIAVASTVIASDRPRCPPSANGGDPIPNARSSTKPAPYRVPIVPFPHISMGNRERRSTIARRFFTLLCAHTKRLGRSPADNDRLAITSAGPIRLFLGFFRCLRLCRKPSLIRCVRS